jgi:hypothetical protein
MRGSALSRHSLLGNQMPVRCSSTTLTSSLRRLSGIVVEAIVGRVVYVGGAAGVRWEPSMRPVFAALKK